MFFLNKFAVPDNIIDWLLLVNDLDNVYKNVHQSCFQTVQRVRFNLVIALKVRKMQSTLRGTCVVPSIIQRLALLFVLCTKEVS